MIIQRAQQNGSLWGGFASDANPRLWERYCTQLIDGLAARIVTLVGVVDRLAISPATPNGFQAATLMLQSRRPPSAIIASNDLNALGVMEAAHQLGRSVPNDLSVVGFDDIQLAALSRIDLTTIHQPKREMGKAAAELLMRNILGDTIQPPQDIVFPIRLVIRGSTTVLQGPVAFEVVKV